VVAGIPKFFRWLSERYPLLSQPIGINGAPPIDNLYLDMNGIIHSCTHGNDPSVQLTEEAMVLRIMNYLDKLVHLVKPQKLLFMAIDGTTPPIFLQTSYITDAVLCCFPSHLHFWGY
jgi:5'-3' exoribonuclease 1